MYPQQPTQPPHSPTPVPEQSGQPTANPLQPGQTQPADPWQLQPTAIQPQPTTPQPQQPQQNWEQPAAPYTPEGIAPIDYLNQIAPKQKATFGFSRKQLALVGGLILIGFIGVAIAAVLQGSRPNIASLSQRVTTRVGATTHISIQARPNLRSRQIDALNSSLTIQLTNTGTGLTKAFSDAGVGVGNAKDSKDDETSQETTEKLEEARLNGVFDRVYAREMSYRLTTIMIQLDTLHKTTDDAALKEYLESTYKNLEPLQKQFEEYNTATG